VGEYLPVMDSRAATEGGPYMADVGAALRGGPAWASPKRGSTFFCTSPYVAFSAQNPSRATVLDLGERRGVRRAAGRNLPSGTGGTPILAGKKTGGTPVPPGIS